MSPDDSTTSVAKLALAEANENLSGVDSEDVLEVMEKINTLLFQDKLFEGWWGFGEEDEESESEIWRSIRSEVCYHVLCRLQNKDIGPRHGERLTRYIFHSILIFFKTILTCCAFSSKFFTEDPTEEMSSKTKSVSRVVKFIKERIEKVYSRDDLVVIKEYKEDSSDDDEDEECECKIADIDKELIGECCTTFTKLAAHCYVFSPESHFLKEKEDSFWIVIQSGMLLVA